MIDKLLLAKIRKCLALGKSSNEHEAAAALGKARELMEAHGITEAMLELAEIEEATARASRTQRPPRWENILAATICHALGVIQFIDIGGDRVFVGKGPRSEVAGYAFAVLFRKLKAARAEYVKSQLRRCKPGRKRARADHFCEGWAGSVYQTVRELMPEPVEDLALRQWLAVQYPNLVSINARAATAKRAENDYWRGHVLGEAENIHVGVGAAAAPLALA